METTAELLDSAKKAQNLPSDYALAKELGIARQRISQIRAGRAVALRDATAVKLANMMHAEPGYVLATIAAQYNSDPVAREAWARTAELLRYDRRKTPGESPTGTERRIRPL